MAWVRDADAAAAKSRLSKNSCAAANRKTTETNETIVFFKKRLKLYTAARASTEIFVV